jgi:hypothetical protein
MSYFFSLGLSSMGAGVSDLICVAMPATEAMHCPVYLSSPPRLFSWLALNSPASGFSLKVSTKWNHCIKLIQ